jgi:hypothetical protein
MAWHGCTCAVCERVIARAVLLSVTHVIQQLLPFKGCLHCRVIGSSLRLILPHLSTGHLLSPLSQDVAALPTR